VYLGSISLTISSATAQQLGIDFEGWNNGGFLTSYSFGYEFQVTSPITVVGLAAWAEGGSLAQNVPVELWTESGTLLQSATIPAGTSPTLGSFDGFADVGITPITLQPGYYDVAAVSGWYVIVNNSTINGITVAPGINLVGGVGTATDGGLAFPGNGPDTGYAGFFGGNIVVSEVPEPSTLALACAGAAGLLAIRLSTTHSRRRRRKESLINALFSRQAQFVGAACAGAVLLMAPSAPAQNLFAGDYSGSIYDYTPGGVRSTFASGFSNPWGLAVDSAGDLFVANT